MSQSKMSVADEVEKKFVIKHVFEDVKKMKQGESMNGPIEYHFNAPWKIRISREGPNLKTYLDCMVPADNAEWSFDTCTMGRTIRRTGEWNHENFYYTFNKNKPSFYYTSYLWNNEGYLNNKDYAFEFTVIINEAVGLNIHQKLIKFDDDLAKEDSDVTLIVKDQKFHVCKMYLAHHSTYFKSLFFGNFPESEKSEIELKDIDPNDFQNYLELIYGECSVEAHSVLGILHVADFFDSKTVLRRCQEFLVRKSKLPLYQKFEAAIKYNLEELKTKCIFEMNSAADLESIVPENSKDFNTDVWKELFKKSISMISK